MSRTRHHYGQATGKVLEGQSDTRHRWWSKETSEYRKRHQKQFRRMTRDALQDDWEDVPQWRPTRGWLTN